MESRTRSAWLGLVAAPLVAALGLGMMLVHQVWWPRWFDNIVSAALLVSAAMLVIKGATSTRARVLSAAWGVAAAVLWGDAFRLLEARNALGESATIPADILAGAGGLLLVLAITGLVQSLPTTRKPFVGTMPPEEELRERNRVRQRARMD
ncbi:MAG: hypothetical protein ACK4RV_09480 [Caulobacter sp.]